MAAEPHPGDLMGLEFSEIELRVLAFMTDNGPARRRALTRRERTVNALMGDKRRA